VTSPSVTRTVAASKPSPKPGASGGQLLPPLDLGRYRRTAIGVSTVSLVALIGLATLVGSGFLGGHQFTGGVAGIQATQPPASVPAVAVATPTPVTPTPVPTPGTDANGFTAAQLAALQQHAWTTVQQLRTDARNGNVFAAQKLLGKSARGLTVSGLVHATFPNVDPTAISIAKAATGTGYVGTIGSDQLTSRDGTHWTFDYGERPLERFGSTLEHDLFWREPRGQHDIEITITAVTVHRSGVDVRLAWRYGPDPRYGDDGHYYAGDQLQIGSITAAGVNLGGARAGALEATAAATTVTVAGQIPTVSRLSIVVEIVNEQSGAAARAFSTISTTFSVR
jgi:hypothetical protein